ncbi:MAG: hypothetical protein H6702_20270 [Myxococcales bacterium]|nr:hypothetical protein [Myxococcales bacterium]
MRPLFTLCLLLAAPPLAAQPTWQVDLHATVIRFEQQVKLEIGDDPGKPLVEDSLFALFGTATWAPLPHLQLGWFARFDRGHQLAARFAGEDAQGRTVTEGVIQGSSTEFWTGPLVRGAWRGLFVELGYGLVGVREDTARTDLPDDRGATAAAFRTSPTVAWLLGVGGQLNVWRTLDVVLRLQYRVRYYTRRGDRPLVGERAHGTQDYTPFIGAAWRF